MNQFNIPRILLFLIYFPLGMIFVWPKPGDSLEAKPTHESGWKDTVIAAQREGTLTIYGNSGYDPIFAEFERTFPGIEVVQVTGRGSASIVPRLLSEQRGGNYLGDIYLSGVAGFAVLLRAKALDPIKPKLTLPEVVDKTKWWHGEHRYLDAEKQYVLIFNGPFRVDAIYNKHLVDPKEPKSYWDLLDSKWKNKIGMFSGVSAPHKFFYYHPALGRMFFNRLFSEMDVNLSKSMHQLVDWLGVGKIALAIAASVHSEVRKAQAQGLPIGVFNLNQFTEGVSLTSGTGAVGLLKEAPHPNAAKVAINWLLSRKGQISFQNNFLNADSLRIDVPKDAIPDEFRRKNGIKYFDVDRLEFTSKPIRDLMAEYTAIEVR